MIFAGMKFRPNKKYCKKNKEFMMPSKDIK